MGPIWLGFLLFKHSVLLLFRNLRLVALAMVLPTLILGGSWFSAPAIVDSLVYRSDLLPLVFGAPFVFAAIVMVVQWHRFVLLEEEIKVFPRVESLRGSWRYTLRACLATILFLLPLELVFYGFFDFQAILLLFAYECARVLIFLLFAPALIGAALGTDPARFWAAVRSSWKVTSPRWVSLLVVAVLYNVVHGVWFMMIGAFVPDVTLVTSWLLLLPTAMLYASLLTTVYGVFVDGRQL